MRALVFAQAINKPGRSDASGAFIPGANHFVRTHNLEQPILLRDHNDRQLVFDSIENASGLDAVVYFGHGTQASLPSANIGWHDLTTMAQLIYNAASANCQVILYACTAGKEGCFGNQLSKLMNYEFSVWGHSCVGHSFTNPYVTCYPFLDNAFVIPPHSPLWSKWVSLVKNERGDFWARYPFMGQSELEEYVAAAPERQQHQGSRHRH